MVGCGWRQVRGGMLVLLVVAGGAGRAGAELSVARDTPELAWGEALGAADPMERPGGLDLGADLLEPVGAGYPADPDSSLGLALDPAFDPVPPVSEPLAFAGEIPVRTLLERGTDALDPVGALAGEISPVDPQGTVLEVVDTVIPETSRRVADAFDPQSGSEAYLGGAFMPSNGAAGSLGVLEVDGQRVELPYPEVGPGQGVRVYRVRRGGGIQIEARSGEKVWILTDRSNWILPFLGDGWTWAPVP